MPLVQGDEQVFLFWDPFVQRAWYDPVIMPIVKLIPAPSWTANQIKTLYTSKENGRDGQR